MRKPSSSLAKTGRPRNSRFEFHYQIFKVSILNWIFSENGIPGHLLNSDKFFPEARCADDLG
jgi:hypothetical protein